MFTSKKKANLRTLAAATCFLAILACGDSWAGKVDETAKSLAGMPQDTNQESLTHPSYAQYASAVGANWKRYETAVYDPIKTWFKTALPPVSSAVVFYPFSGPDFPTVHAVYPDAGRYVMVAIQKAGKPLDYNALSAAERERLLAQISKSSQKFGHIGFFLTNDLDENAAKNGVSLSPTLTLMFFASRLGFSIEGISPLKIANDGQDVEVDDASNLPTWNSVRLELKKNSRTVIVDYLRIDLSDGNLVKSENQRKFIEKFSKYPTFLKAASHLPQNGGFTIIRNAIVNSAPIVVQDETGIEYGLLSKNFSVKLYGGFTRPHRLFDVNHQKALAAAYAVKNAASPLPFIVGYNKQSGSSLQIASRLTKESETLKQAKSTIEKENPAKTQSANIANPPKAETAAQLTAKPTIAVVKTDAPTTIVSAEKVSDHRLALAQNTSKTSTTLTEPALNNPVIKSAERKLFIGAHDQQSIHSEYLKRVTDNLNKRLNPSRNYFKKSQKIILTLIIERTGAIRNVELDRSSGNAYLDRHVMASTKTIKSLPEFPKTLSNTTDLLGVVFWFPSEQ